MLLVLLVAAVAVLTPPAIAAEEDPRHVVEAYYAAIDRGDYRTAYMLWDGRVRRAARALPPFATASPIPRDHVRSQALRPMATPA